MVRGNNRARTAGAHGGFDAVAAVDEDSLTMRLSASSQVDARCWIRERLP
jgi:hypothetical protein